MPEDQLAASIVELERKLRNSDASVELQRIDQMQKHVEQLLKDLVKKYPESEAAERATEMLRRFDSDEDPGSAGFGSQAPEPDRIDRF